MYFLLVFTLTIITASSRIVNYSGLSDESLYLLANRIDDAIKYETGRFATMYNIAEEFKYGSISKEELLDHIDEMLQTKVTHSRPGKKFPDLTHMTYDEIFKLKIRQRLQNLDKTSLLEILKELELHIMRNITFDEEYYLKMSEKDTDEVIYEILNDVYYDDVWRINHPELPTILLALLKKYENIFLS